MVNPFADVSEADYFYNPVMWAVGSGITSGMTPTTFAPNTAMTRAMLVTVLYRAAGSPEVTTGGRALKFYASVRIDVRRVETLKSGGEMIGNRTRAKVVKNKVAPPFREAEFDIMYGKGISHIGEIVDLGLKFDILKRSGAWFYYGDTRLAQGRDNTKILFEENEALTKEVEAKIIAAMQGEEAEETAAAAPVAPAEPAPATTRRRKVNIDIAVDD